MPSCRAGVPWTQVDSAWIVPGFRSYTLDTVGIIDKAVLLKKSGHICPDLVTKMWFSLCHVLQCINPGPDKLCTCWVHTLPPYRL